MTGRRGTTCVGIEQVESGDEWDIVRHDSKAPTAPQTAMRCHYRRGRAPGSRRRRKDGEGYALATVRPDAQRRTPSPPHACG